MTFKNFKNYTKLELLSEVNNNIPSLYLVWQTVFFAFNNLTDILTSPLF